MDKDNEPGGKEGVQEEAAPGTSQLKATLGLVGHYLLMALAPVVSVVALIVAVMAYNSSQANLARLEEANARIESLKLPQAEPRNDTDIFQVSLAREKALLAEERKKQSERESIIIRNVSQLQVKSRISPTLEEQLKEQPKAPATATPEMTTPAVSAPVAAIPVAATGKAPVPAAAPVQAVAAKQPAAPASTTAPSKNAPAQKPAAAPVTAPHTAPPVKDAVKKPAPAPAAPAQPTKADALKKTIEEFNKIDRKK